MAKTFVKDKVCQSCGADVRPGSVFCYNCGEAVVEPARNSENNHRTKTVREALIEEDNRPDGSLETTRLDSPPPAEKSIDRPIPKPSIQDDAKLKSAASLRRKSKSFQNKRVEIVWEEPDTAPNKWFPLVALIVVLFVAVIFYLAMYLK